MKHFIVVLALVSFAVAAYAGVATLHTGILTNTGYQAPSLHTPWASSVDTGIRRFGSTGAVLAAAVPAYYQPTYAYY